MDIFGSLFKRRVPVDAVGDAARKQYEAFSNWPAEFNGAQSPRPEWQKGLSLDELTKIDRMANAAYKGGEALAQYVAYTRILRKDP